MNLLEIEKQACDIVGPLNISIAGKMQRVQKVLNLITTIYNVHNEEISPQEAYEILYLEEQEYE